MGAFCKNKFAKIPVTYSSMPARLDKQATLLLFEKLT